MMTNFARAMVVLAAFLGTPVLPVSSALAQEDAATRRMYFECLGWPPPELVLGPTDLDPIVSQKPHFDGLTNLRDGFRRELVDSAEEAILE